MDTTKEARLKAVRDALGPNDDPTRTLIQATYQADVLAKPSGNIAPRGFGIGQWTVAVLTALDDHDLIVVRRKDHAHRDERVTDVLRRIDERIETISSWDPDPDHPINQILIDARQALLYCMDDLAEYEDA